MTAEYDAESGATRHPDESDQARRAREERERSGAGQPDTEGDVTDEQQKAAAERKRQAEAERASKGEGTGYVSREDAPNA